MEVSIDIPNGFKDIKSFDVRHTPIIGAFCEKINFSSTMDRALDTKMEASPGKIVKVLIFDTLAGRNPLYSVSDFFSHQDTELLVGKGASEVDILNELYIYLGQYTNFFQPVVKLISKTRTGNKVTKKYDEGKTPYRIVLESKYIDDKIKASLRCQYDSLNPAELKRKISKLQDKILKLNTLKQKVGKDLSLDEKPHEYILT